MEPKKKRQRAAPAMVHTAVVLSQETIDRLKQSERGLSEEIRRRVNQSLNDDAYDPQTRDLGAAVMWLADQLRQHTGAPWHATSKGHEALDEALRTYLSTLKQPPESAFSDLFGPDDPQTLGRAIARHYVRFKAAQEKTIQELRERHKGEKP